MEALVAPRLMPIKPPPGERRRDWLFDAKRIDLIAVVTEAAEP